MRNAWIALLIAMTASLALLGLRPQTASAG